ncbi:MAG: PAS domain-containing protein [Gemmatimonadaceae bacterium]|nr:PAS domain-containing protein [Gemmatimonadaceae bacterium]
MHRAPGNSPLKGHNNVQTDSLTDAQLRDQICRAFGLERDSMETVSAQAFDLLPGRDLIVWEGDAQTFQFSFVSDSARTILGYPLERWTTEPTFWADTVVHPEDRSDAIAFCALATGRCRDHDFVYRAIAADGRTVILHDVVKVIIGAKGVASTPRGIMLDVTDEQNEFATGAG